MYNGDVSGANLQYSKYVSENGSQRRVSRIALER